MNTQNELIELEEEKLQHLKNMGEDRVSDLLYYDRKECEYVTREDIDKLSNKQIQELAEHIKICVLKNLK